MRFFFDTEFIEDGHTIDLVSIGIVSYDGREYYAESYDCNLGRASDWVRQNVFPHLIGGDSRKPRQQIAKEIVSFVGDDPVFWAYFADYDWVALCQLYGRMIDLPKGWPMFCRDVQQLYEIRGWPDKPPQDFVEHHALGDARWVKKAFHALGDANSINDSSGAPHG